MATTSGIESTAPSRAWREWRQLGMLLVEQGLLGREELERALATQVHTHQMLGEILVQAGLVSHTSLARAIADQYGVPVQGEQQRAELARAGQESLVQRVGEHEEAMRQIADRLDEQRSRVHHAEARIADREARLAELETALARNAALVGQLAEHEASICDLATRLESQSGRLQAAESRLEQRELRLAELESRLEEWLVEREDAEPLLPLPVAAAPVREPDEDGLAQRIAAATNLPLVDLRSFDIDFGVARFLPEPVAKRQLALPIRLQQGVVIVAVADPTDPAAVAEVARVIGRAVRFVVADRDALIDAISGTYAN